MVSPFGLIGVGYRLLTLLMVLASGNVLAQQSECFGTTSQGYLKNGVALPSKGENFVSYSQLANWLGRNYVHSMVRAVVVDAYADLNKSLPDKIFKYAETGFEDGGEFKPHKTHRNGLSVDFMVPVKNETGESLHLPTGPLNKWGYAIDLDQKGRYENLTIDYEAMAAHIVQLHKASLKNGVDIWRVIFDPDLQPYLLETQYRDYLSDNITFSTKRSWVRHDEHYHVDFQVPCSSL